MWKVFERQCEVGIANLARIHEAVGDKVSVVMVSGTDFGMQQGPFISPQSYRDLYFPFHKAVNDWIHTNTGWKTFIHTCGGVAPLIEDFIAARFDIMNPVQVGAAGMEATSLKARFGDRVPSGAEGSIRSGCCPLARQPRRAGGGVAAHRRVRPRRGVRVQHRAQRAGEGAGGESDGVIWGYRDRAYPC